MTKSSFFNFSAIYCPIIVKFGGHLPFSIIYKKETFISNHQGILENNIQVTLDKEHLRKNFFLCKSIIDNNNIGDLCVRKFIPRSIRRNLCTKKSIYQHRNNLRSSIKVFFQEIYWHIMVLFLSFQIENSFFPFFPPF